MGDLRILSIIPPMTQLNTPYPSTAYLTGFLHARGYQAWQADLSLGLAHKLLSISGLQAVLEELTKLPPKRHIPCITFFIKHAVDYSKTIKPTIRFLQGKDPTLAHRIASRRFLPEGPRFSALEQYDPGHDGAHDALDWAFGSLGIIDYAKHVATLYLNDIADVIRDGIDSRFEFVRYAEALAASQPTFDQLHAALHTPPNILDDFLHTLTADTLATHQPNIVLITAPFPGNVYGAFRIAQSIKALDPAVVTVLGGGYCNTELRSLNEPRVFNYFDFITLDSGERPLLALLEYLQDQRPVSQLVRTYTRTHHYIDFQEPDIPLSETGTPTYAGLPINDYLSLLDMLNPMHRLWSDGRWNKITVAHGCYWKKCSFCDVSLDYISRYDVANTEIVIQRIESMVRETGQTGFHLVDEAAPPKALKSLANALIERDLNISWWGNIRFEKSFNAGLCQRMADSGCIAVTGGLEVASDRLLSLMDKGVSIDQVARVTRDFSDAGILVHAYLMYGFPTQTEQETIDSLEYVRQLFVAGCIQSGFFHRFTCTAHSPVGKNPQKYGVRLARPGIASFANNDIQFIDDSGVDHDRYAAGLKKALFNYMHGIGLDLDVREWFEQPAAGTTARKPGRRKSTFTVPATTVSPDRIERALGEL
jgi:radical SAM superfamily enzyme YgiQ (UPF0313 family)